MLTETTADFGFALMMATARRISESERFLREGRWKHWGVDMFAGGDVHGATLGILGMGRIGQAIARRGHGGFDMKVAYHNRSHLAPDVEASLGATWMTLPDLLRAADHLVIVTPYTPADAPPGRRRAARADEADGHAHQHRARRRGRRRGAGRGAGRRHDRGRGPGRVRGRARRCIPALLALRNVVLTPHIASASVPTRRAMANLAVDNLLAALGVGPTPAGRRRR